MASKSMTIKQLHPIIESYRNLCEVSMEYPTLQHSSIPRHLCTFTLPMKKSDAMTMQRLSGQSINDHHEKDSNKHSKQSQEEMELIQLDRDEEMVDKLYKKRPYRLTRRNDEEI